MFLSYKSKTSFSFQDFYKPKINSTAWGKWRSDRKFLPIPLFSEFWRTPAFTLKMLFFFFLKRCFIDWIELSIAFSECLKSENVVMMKTCFCIHFMVRWVRLLKRWNKSKAVLRMIVTVLCFTQYLLFRGHRWSAMHF